MQNTKKIMISLSLFIQLFCMAAVFSQTKIISPAEGKWQNPQSLILEVQDGCEVYYSLNGSDPLKSGFAYDGPVEIPDEGDFIMTIVTVLPDGKSSSQIIGWSVAGKNNPSYIPLKDGSPYIDLFEDTLIKIPDGIHWAVGDASDSPAGVYLMQTGGTISTDGSSTDERYITLIINEDAGYYRYVMKLNSNTEYMLSKPAAEKQDVEFPSWNYVRLMDGRNVLYSLDDGPWIQTRDPIFIDRSADHKLMWKPLTPVYSYEDFSASVEPEVLEIPAKPDFTDVTDGFCTNKAVIVSPDNDDYVLEYVTEDGRSLFLRSYYANTVTGDVRVFNPTFTVYYKGLKQGTVSASIKIDKRAPAAPVIGATEYSGFSRNPVELSFESDSQVYYRIYDPVELDGGYSIEAVRKNGVSADDDGDYIPLNMTDASIVLSGTDKALFYRISAYAEDEAGNRSDTVDFSTVIDHVNYYVVSEDVKKNNLSKYDSSYPEGTSENPFSSIESAVSACQKFNNTVLKVEGVFSNVQNLVFYRDCTITGLNGARIIMGNESMFTVKGASLTMSGFSIEKNVNPDGSIFQKNLFSVSDGSLLADDCEFFCSFDASGTGFTVENGKIVLDGCGITLKASSYAAAVSAAVSDLKLQNVRIVCTARTAVGVSATGGSISMDNDRITVNGSYGRCAELSNMLCSFHECTFDAKNVSSASPAIWIDSKSIVTGQSNNNFSGFSSLMKKASR